MTNKINKIPLFVKNFFDSCEIDEKINRFSFFMIRGDGVVLYSNNNSTSKMDKSSIGALLSGVWQASKALSTFIPTNEAEDVFRLSFDTSSQGIYIVPVQSEIEELYLGLIYHEEINPGFLKNKMREMALSFSVYLSNELKTNSDLISKPSKTINKNEYLFSDISDAEMDQMFAFTKN